MISRKAQAKERAFSEGAYKGELPERRDCIMENSQCVRFADLEDIHVCRQKDYDHVTSAIIEFKIKQKEIILSEVKNVIVGYLRIEYLWSHIPYIGLITVEDDFRKQGIGKSMLQFLESHLISMKHDVLYSSSQVNEAEPQAWHRHMGFKECGIISGINPGGIGEIFFRKNLGRN